MAGKKIKKRPRNNEERTTKHHESLLMIIVVVVVVGSDAYINDGKMLPRSFTIFDNKVLIIKFLGGVVIIIIFSSTLVVCIVNSFRGELQIKKFNVFVVQGQSMFAGSGGRKRKCGLSSLLLL